MEHDVKSKIKSLIISMSRKNMTIRFKFTLPINITRGICCWSDLLQRVEECRHVEPASMDSTVQHLGALVRN